MKSKRRISIILVLAMVFSMFPSVLFFSETAEASVHEPVDWPSDEAFLPYVYADNKGYVKDPGADVNPTSSDITSGTDNGVGNLPSVYVASVGNNDADRHVFFRYRIKGDPYDRKGGITSTAYLVQLWDNGVHKATVGVNGKPTDKDYVYVASGDGTKVARVYETADNPVNGMTVLNGARIVPADNSHYFLDFQIPLERINDVLDHLPAESRITGNTRLQILYGTSQAANLSVINKEYLVDSEGGQATFASFQEIQMGNLGGALSQYQETTYPTVSIETITGTLATGASGLVFSNNAITVNGTVSENLPIKIDINGIVKSTITPTSDENGGWNWTVALNNPMIVPDTQGSYLITANVIKSINGTNVTVRESKIFDIEKEAGEQLAFDKGSIAFTTTSTPAITGKYQSKQGNSARVRIKINEAAYKAANPNHQTKVWDYAVVSTDNLQQGANTIIVQLTNSNGNTVYATATQQLYYYLPGSTQSVPVSVSIGEVTGNANPTIAGSSTGAKTVEVQIDGKTVEIVTPAADGSWSISTIETPLAQGTHEIKAIAINQAATEIAISKATHNVTLLAISIDNGSSVTLNDNAPTIRGTTNATNEGNVAVVVQGEQFNKTYNATVLNSHWMIELGKDNDQLSGGTYTVTATVTEEQSTATVTQTMTLDLTEFTVFLAETGNKAQSVAFNLSITNAKNTGGLNLNGNHNVTVTSNTADDQIYNAQVSFNDGSATVNVALAQLGLHTLTVNITGVTNNELVMVNIVEALPVLEGTISGTVTADGGGAISGAAVTVEVGGTSYAATTDTNGDYSMSGVPAGTHTVSFSATGYISSTTADVEVTAGQTTTGIDKALVLVPTTGTISGTVTADGGGAISGAAVTVEVGGTSYAATTDTNGDYSMSGVPAGTHTVSFSATGYISNTTESVEVTAGQTTTGIDKALVLAVTSITVTGENGATGVITNQNLQMIATITPENATKKIVTWSVTNGTGSASINAEGELTGNTAGTVTVKATATDGSGIFGEATITVNLSTPGAPATATMTVSPGNISVEDHTGQDAIVTSTVEVRDSEGNIISEGSEAGTFSVTVPARAVEGTDYEFNTTTGGLTIKNGAANADGSYEITYTNTADINVTASGVVTVAVSADTIAPVITRLGDATVELVVGDIYTDAGATAQDNIDGNITDNIVTVNPVDTSVAGIYAITYNASDASGNAATEVTRTVTIAPAAVIAAGSIDGTVTINGGTSGATIILYDKDGIEVATGVIGNDGTFTFTGVAVGEDYYAIQTVYGIESAHSNAVSIGADTIAPVITRLGEAAVAIVVGDTYTDAGATALDDIDGNITDNIVTVNPVDTSVAGIYTITYNVSDASGNAATEVSRTVTIAPAAIIAAGSIDGAGTVSVSGANSNSTVTIYDNNGGVVATGTTDGDGKYIFEGVTAGTGYQVTQTVNGVESEKSAGVTVAPAKPEPIESTVNDAEGTVEVSNLVPGATVTLKDEDGNIISQGMADEDGKFTFTDVEKGLDYTVTQTVNGAESEELQIRLLTDEEEIDDTLKGLKIGYVEESDTWESVTSNLYLFRTDANETNIQWSSSNPSVVTVTNIPATVTSSETGFVSTVQRQPEERSIIVTAAVSKGSITKIRTFLLIVKATGISKAVDSTVTRNESIGSGNDLAVTRINVSGSGITSTIDKVIVNAESNVTSSAISTVSGQSKLVIPLQESSSNPASEFAIEVPREAVAKLAEVNAAAGIQVKNTYAEITIAASQLNTMRQNNLDLFFRIVPIKEDAQSNQVKGNSVTEVTTQASALGVSNKDISALGKPLKIETNYSGYTTQLFIPFAGSGITVPTQNRTMFLNALAVYVQHTDNTRSLKRVTGYTNSADQATVVYDGLEQPIGLSIEIDRFSTFTILEVKDQVVQQPVIPSDGGAPAQPQVEKITINVETGSIVGGSVVSNETINRTRNTDGTKKDEVTLTDDGVKKAIEQVKQANQSVARIVIPDERDEVSEIRINIPKDLANLYATEGIDLEIYTEHGRLLIPFKSLKDLPADFYFRIVPIKEEARRQQVEAQIKTEQITLAKTDGKNVELAERPYTIETNMPSRPVVVTLPLKETIIPAIETERQHYLNNMFIYIEHSDGDRAVKLGDFVVYDAQGRIYGYQFQIEKFSTFAIVKMASEIREYSIIGQTKPAVIDSTTGTITVEVPKDADITKLVAEFLLSSGASAAVSDIVQISGVTANDFSQPLVYRITGADGTVKIWTVYVEITDEVVNNHPALPTQESLWHQAYMKGYPDGTFKPQRSITRAEMATILTRVHELTMEASDTGNSYPDIGSHWAKGNIIKVSNSGLMKGYPDSNFKPDGQITRAEFATIIARWLELTGSAERQYTDTQGHWGNNYIALVSISGLMKGYPDGSFKPNQSLTRAEAVTVINRLLDRGPLYGMDSPRWVDVPMSHWAFHDIEEASQDHYYNIVDAKEMLIK